eukprot:9541109-Prorocentrum_lima.AAC.1
MRAAMQTAADPAFMGPMLQQLEDLERSFVQQVTDAKPIQDRLAGISESIADRTRRLQSAE